MAKMFYTMDEARTALGKNEEEIRQYSREGRLREFRDGARLMFKADQVEQLKSELGGDAGRSGAGDHVDIGISDSGGLIGLADTGMPSGPSLSLSDTDTNLPGGTTLGGTPVGGTPMHGTAAGTTGGIRIKDETALASDLGLAGSLGGVPSPGRLGDTGTGMAMTGTSLGGTGMGLGGTTLGGGTNTGSGTGRTGSGVNVFGGEDLPDRADPAAQTSISAGVRDQMNLEGVGSGSGLLDLTRESDDTSLGAVLDEIAPAGAGRRGPVIDTGTAAGTSVGMSMVDDPGMAPAARTVAAPVYVQAADALAPAFGAASLAGFGAMLFGTFVLISALTGVWPPAAQWFQSYNFFIPVLIGLGIAVFLFVIGMIIGKAGTTRGR